MYYLLKDIHGNEVATTSKNLAIEILESGTNPFNRIEELNTYKGLTVNTLEEFGNIFY